MDSAVRSNTERYLAVSEANVDLVIRVGSARQDLFIIKTLTGEAVTMNIRPALSASQPLEVKKSSTHVVGTRYLVQASSPSSLTLLFGLHLPSLNEDKLLKKESNSSGFTFFQSVLQPTTIPSGSVADVRTEYGKEN
ncbi:hypothetical protein J6590_082854 [Homalodisca vitripennis]|nr:hypothetical protein J6590_082854 [Homalodisca vitripennis]